jgi:hypothetical protein
MDTEKNEDIPAAEKPLCRNCNKKMPRKAEFCPHCGQKNFDGRIRMRDLLGKFFFHIVHFDGKFLRGAWDLLQPAKVTLAYFEGKIKRYPHPVQFFFIIMFFFLYTLSKSFDNGGFNVSGSIGKNKVEVNNGVEPKSGGNLYQVLQRYTLGQDIRKAYKQQPDSLKSHLTDRMVDSLLQALSGPENEMARRMFQAQDSLNDYKQSGDSLNLNFINKQIRVATADIVHLEPDALVERYQIHSWLDRILLKQSLRSIRDPQSLIHAYLGSLTWAIIVLIALMAGILMLLYYRQHRYYVEHFIFLLHQHSSAFLALTLLLLIHQFYPLGAWWVLFFLGICVFLLLAMRRFYGQATGKTILKWLLYCTLYGIAFLLLFVIGLLVVFLLY